VKISRKVFFLGGGLLGYFFGSHCSWNWKLGGYVITGICRPVCLLASVCCKWKQFVFTICSKCCKSVETCCTHVGFYTSACVVPFVFVYMFVWFCVLIFCLAATTPQCSFVFFSFHFGSGLAVFRLLDVCHYKQVYYEFFGNYFAFYHFYCYLFQISD